MIPIKEYFSKMALKKRQIQKRIEMAEEIEEILLLFLLSIAIEQKYDIEKTAKERFIEDYTEVVKKYIEDDDFVAVYVVLVAALLEDTTIRHIDDEYFTSEDRAISIAEDQANIVLNRSDYNDAVINGYTRKQWVTEEDNRVRKTHEEVNRVIIPIDDLFVVGNAVMRFPGDLEYGADAHPEEISNCRCVVEYLK